MSEGQKVEIDGRQYVLDDLSDVAKEQLASLRVTDQEIMRLQTQISIMQTARMAYANALKAELPTN